MACYGVASNVEKLQTATGTKDKIAQHWIEILLRKAREIKAQPNPDKKTAKELVNEIFDWFKAQPGEKFNPLLLLDSNAHFLNRYYSKISYNVDLQVSIHRRTLQLRFFTQFY